LAAGLYLPSSLSESGGEKESRKKIHKKTKKQIFIQTSMDGAHFPTQNQKKKMNDIFQDSMIFCTVKIFLTFKHLYLNCSYIAEKKIFLIGLSTLVV